MTDAVAARYGWLPHQIRETPWRQVLHAAHAREREEKECWRRAAFTAFLSGAGAKNQKFHQFLKQVGLGTEQEQKALAASKQDRTTKAQERVTDALRIARADKRGKQ